MGGSLLFPTSHLWSLAAPVLVYVPLTCAGFRVEVSPTPLSVRAPPKGSLHVRFPLVGGCDTSRYSSYVGGGPGREGTPGSPPRDSSHSKPRPRDSTSTSPHETPTPLKSPRSRPQVPRCTMVREWGLSVGVGCDSHLGGWNRRVTTSQKEGWSRISPLDPHCQGSLPCRSSGRDPSGVPGRS